MGTRNERASGWFRLSRTYYLDPKILKVSESAELLFVRMLALSDATNNGGLITAEQVLTINRGMRNLNAKCDELVDAKLLAYAPVVRQQGDSSAPVTRQQGATNAPTTRQQGATSAPVVRKRRAGSAWVAHDYVIVGYHKWKPADEDETAGHSPERPAAASRQTDAPRARTGRPAPAREKRDRQTDRTESSPAPPDGLDSVARSAPRLGGAESRPAPKEEKIKNSPNGGEPGDDGDSLVGLDHLTGPELAKAALAKAIANGSRPNRLPVRMSKYPRELHANLETERAGDEE